MRAGFEEFFKLRLYIAIGKNCLMQFKANTNILTEKLCDRKSCNSLPRLVSKGDASTFTGLN